jgi:hypothetical protein
MRLTAGTGNLLIGTTTDGGQKLQVVSGDSYIARFTDGSTASLNIQKSAIVFANAGISAYAAGNYDASSHTFKIQTATALTVTSNGNVLIGTTTDGGYKLDVNGTARIQSNLTVSGGTTTLTGTAYLDLDEAANRRWRVFPNGGIFTVRDMVAVADYLTITGGSGDATVGGSIKTRAPSGGTAKPWELGEAATVSPTSPNRTIRVEIDGTVYYIHAKTTND